MSCDGSLELHINVKLETDRTLRLRFPVISMWSAAFPFIICSIIADADRSAYCEGYSAASDLILVISVNSFACTARSHLRDAGYRIR